MSENLNGNSLFNEIKESVEANTIPVRCMISLIPKEFHKYIQKIPCNHICKHGNPVSWCSICRPDIKPFYDISDNQDKLKDI